MAHATFRAQRQFSAAAKRAVLKQGVGLSSNCQQQLERLIRTGVERLNSQRALHQDAKLRLAEENLMRCVRRMSDESERLGTYPVADERCLSNALTSLCPLWPFC